MNEREPRDVTDNDVLRVYDALCESASWSGESGECAGYFGEVAAAAHVRRPEVSEAIRALEWLGLVSVERPRQAGKTRTRFTPVGRCTADDVLAALDAWDAGGVQA